MVLVGLLCYCCFCVYVQNCLYGLWDSVISKETTTILALSTLTIAAAAAAYHRRSRTQTVTCALTPAAAFDPFVYNHIIRLPRPRPATDAKVFFSRSQWTAVDSFLRLSLSAAAVGFYGPSETCGNQNSRARPYDDNKSLKPSGVDNNSTYILRSLAYIILKCIEVVPA